MAQIHPTSPAAESDNGVTPTIEQAPDGSSPDKAAPEEAQPEEPTPAAPPPRDPTEIYLNRELTWLAFNWRVLHEAEDPRTPLLERVAFLAIVCNNLDEFFMKRIGGLMQQLGAGIHKVTVDGRTPQQQLTECQQVAYEQAARAQQRLIELTGALRQAGIELREYTDLDPDDQTELRERYIETIFPLVTPQAMDPAHPFPFVSNLSLNLLVTLRHPGEPIPLLARMKVPIGAGIPRFLQLEGRTVFVRLEDVMANNLDLAFPGMEVVECDFFRVTRNAIAEKDEEQADDLLAMIESELRERKFAPTVRLQVSASMSVQHRGHLAAEVALDGGSDVVEVSGMLGMRDLWQIAKLDIAELHHEPHHPVDHPAFTTNRNIFHILRDQGDLLVYHPMESFSSSVERFLKEASVDPKVRAIKTTLYRTSENTRVVQHLIDAARNGKQVAVAVELKARFDEQANIRWASELEEVGIHVSYGVVGLKTHCKVILVVRQDHDGLRRYAHIGTGNYHADTARIYFDLGLFTCNPTIGGDLTELFNYLTTGYKPKRSYKKILPAPKHLKPALLKKIRREIDKRTAEEPGHIQMKMNGLEDADIVSALYEASQAGVQVDLIVRDTCRLRPGIPGLSENIRVISIVGRFLEHARIFYFRNGGDEEYFLGSADLMERNLKHRVELVVPVERPALRKELRQLLDLQLGDQRNVWEMQPDATYVQRTPEDADDIGCQMQLVRWVERRHRKATRLKKRKPRGVRRRPWDVKR